MRLAIVRQHYHPDGAVERGTERGTRSAARAQRRHFAVHAVVAADAPAADRAGDLRSVSHRQALWRDWGFAARRAALDSPGRCRASSSRTSACSAATSTARATASTPSGSRSGRSTRRRQRRLSARVLAARSVPAADRRAPLSRARGCARSSASRRWSATRFMRGSPSRIEARQSSTTRSTRGALPPAACVRDRPRILEASPASMPARRSSSSSAAISRTVRRTTAIDALARAAAASASRRDRRRAAAISAHSRSRASAGRRCSRDDGRFARRRAAALRRRGRLRGAASIYDPSPDVAARSDGVRAPGHRQHEVGRRRTAGTSTSADSRVRRATSPRSSRTCARCRTRRCARASARKRAARSCRFRRLRRDAVRSCCCHRDLLASRPRAPSRRTTTIGAPSGRRGARSGSGAADSVGRLDGDRFSANGAYIRYPEAA